MFRTFFYVSFARANQRWHYFSWSDSTWILLQIANFNFFNNPVPTPLLDLQPLVYHDSATVTPHAGLGEEEHFQYVCSTSILRWNWSRMSVSGRIWSRKRECLLTLASIEIACKLGCSHQMLQTPSCLFHVRSNQTSVSKKKNPSVHIPNQ